ncbi:reticulon-4-interacting protein 1, mitochondrial precursor [Whalleya microplaca]|nr:reticulon-4-interacting protein 1, mitochondrial precursor [Whalleya microplaca]
MASPKNTSTMRAWLYTSAHEGLEKSIELKQDAAQPQHLAKGEILVKVHSASINPADYKVAESGLLRRLLVSPPASPGMDFAGTVAKIGDGVDVVKAGDLVFGKILPAKFGSLGEYLVAKAGGYARVPEGVGLEDASTVGTAGLTALQAIVPYVVAGDKVFINGGSGGTGTWEIQVAKAVGCHVTVSCSGKNADFCRGLGADEVIDYAKEDVVAALKAKGPVYKLVVDNMCGGPPPDLHKAADDFLLPEGKFVQVGGSFALQDVKTMFSRMLLPSFLGGGKRKFVFFLQSNSHDDLVKLANWMKEGKVKPVIDEVFEFEDAPKAFEKLKTHRARGKIVVRGPK